MHTNHLKFWPARVAKTLTVPETTLYDNLVITAKKYPNKTAVHYYGADIRIKNCYTRLNNWQVT